MATSIVNQDGMLSVTLTSEEQETLSGLPLSQLDAYLTLWLEEHGKNVLSERFSKLSTKDKSDVLAVLKK